MKKTTLTLTYKFEVGDFVNINGAVGVIKEVPPQHLWNEFYKIEILVGNALYETYSLIESKESQLEYQKYSGVPKIDWDKMMTSFICESMTTEMFEHIKMSLIEFFEFYDLKELLYTLTFDKQKQRIAISPIREIDKYALKGLLSDD